MLKTSLRIEVKTEHVHKEHRQTNVCFTVDMIKFLFLWVLGKMNILLTVKQN